MKSLLLFLILVGLIFLALIVQDFLPPLSDLKNAHILLVPVLFTYGALVLPFPAMLALALFTGLITDLSILQVIEGKVEIGLGWSIVLYTGLGTVMQGVRKAFFEGAWWIHPPLSALCTFLLLSLQYIMITFHRGNVVLNETVLWKILVPSAIAFLISPIVEALFISIERALPHPHRSSRGY